MAEQWLRSHTDLRTAGRGLRGRVGRLPIDEAATLVVERARHLQDEVELTLAALKRVLEAGATGP